MNTYYSLLDNYSIINNFSICNTKISFLEIITDGFGKYNKLIGYCFYDLNTNSLITFINADESVVANKLNLILKDKPLIIVFNKIFTANFIKKVMDKYNISLTLNFIGIQNLLQHTKQIFSFNQYNREFLLSTLNYIFPKNIIESKNIPALSFLAFNENHSYAFNTIELFLFERLRSLLFISRQTIFSKKMFFFNNSTYILLSNLLVQDSYIKIDGYTNYISNNYSNINSSYTIKYNCISQKFSTELYLTKFNEKIDCISITNNNSKIWLKILENNKFNSTLFFKWLILNLS